MNSSKLFSSLFAYKTWTNAGMYKVLLEVASGPGADEWREAIRMMNHMYVIDKIFAAHLTGAAHGYSGGNTPETPEIGALYDAVKETDAWYAGYVSTLTEEQLAEVIPFTFTDGLQGSMSRAEILMHVITHGSYHRGMVGQMIAESGTKAPPDTLTRSLHIAEPGRRTVQPGWRIHWMRHPGLRHTSHVMHQARSKRSRFITLVQAATKSWTNFFCASAPA